MFLEPLTEPVLTMIDGPTPGRSFTLDRPSYTLGRDPDCDLVLSLSTVSRRHARIARREGGYEIEDLGSSGGTLLNGRPLRGPARLGDGDRIGVGGCLIAYFEPTASPSTATARAETILGRREATGAAERALVGVRSEEKLAALLEVTGSLVGAIDLGDVLDQALDALFRLFPRAERGFVLLEDEEGGGLVPAAVKVRRGESAGPILSRTIVDYVMRKGQAILSRDVTTDDRFEASPSVADAHIRTLLCVPLRDHDDRPAGILQLDTSDLLAGFTPEDLDLLVAVASQVGLAVDNARLLERARREHRRLELLAAAGAELAATLDIDRTLGSVARLAVPYLADLCLVDLIADDGTVRRVAAVHADPARQPLVDELARHAPDPAGTHPAMVALRTGLAEESGSIADISVLETTTRDAEHLALVRQLDFRSYLCLPLVARGRTLGALTLVATGDRRPIVPADRATAEELARRVASAAENARLYREVREAGQAKDRFLAVLSHELRTPLTPVLVAVSAQLDGDVPADRPTLEMIRRNVELEARLIDDLLDVAQIGRGQMRLDLEVLDAHETIRRAVEICREEASEADLDLVLELSARARHVRADPTRLLQVFWNLIRNAAKFTPTGGSLTIRTSNAPGPAGDSSGLELVVEFRDTGPGIEPGLGGRIFEPFEQGSPTLRGRRGGLGLGLAIGRAIAEAHGGRLTVHDTGPGLGSTFRMTLPTDPAGVGEIETPAPPSPPPGVAGLKVLLVEDNRDTRCYLATVLRMRGHEVAEAANLAEARAAAGSNFGLLLSDIELPDGSGLELMRELDGSGVAAIAMSGYGSVEDVRMSLAAGFVEHLTKPIDLRRLEAALRRATATR